VGLTSIPDFVNKVIHNFGQVVKKTVKGEVYYFLHFDNEIDCWDDPTVHARYYAGFITTLEGKWFKKQIKRYGYRSPKGGDYSRTFDTIEAFEKQGVISIA